MLYGSFLEVNSETSVCTEGCQELGRPPVLQLLYWLPIRFSSRYWSLPTNLFIAFDFTEPLSLLCHHYSKLEEGKTMYVTLITLGEWLKNVVGRFNLEKMAQTPLKGGR